MSEVITLGRRLNDLNIKIQDKILSNEKLIKLLASKTNDLSDIKEVDCPNDYVDKNIFFTIKNFEEAVSDSKNLMMMSFKVNSSTPQYANITIEFIILVHKDLQELKNGDGVIAIFNKAKKTDKKIELTFDKNKIYIYNIYMYISMFILFLIVVIIIIIFLKMRKKNKINNRFYE